MKKLALSLGFIGLFSGCGMQDKSIIDLTCIDGKVYVDWYKAEFVDSSENIRLLQYLVRDKSLYLDDNNMPLQCIKN